MFEVLGIFENQFVYFPKLEYLLSLLLEII